MTPTDEIIEKKESEVELSERIEKTDPKEDNRTVETAESVTSDNFSNVVSADPTCENVDDITNDKQPVNSFETVMTNSEAVPIVENSAVFVELEPSKNESSLVETAVVQSNDNDSKLGNEGAVDSETEVPPVENIPTISQFCDPSHYDNTTNNILNDVAIDSVNVNHPESSPTIQTAKPSEELKRRVSLPSNTVENHSSDRSRDPIVQAISPQKRPRSASTSTQVDANLFGMYT